MSDLDFLFSNFLQEIEKQKRDLVSSAYGDGGERLYKRMEGEEAREYCNILSNCLSAPGKITDIRILKLSEGLDVIKKLDMDVDVSKKTYLPNISWLKAQMNTAKNSLEELKGMPGYDELQKEAEKNISNGISPDYQIIQYKKKKRLEKIGDVPDPKSFDINPAVEYWGGKGKISITKYDHFIESLEVAIKRHSNIKKSQGLKFNLFGRKLIEKKYSISPWLEKKLMDSLDLKSGEIFEKLGKDIKEHTFEVDYLVLAERLSVGPFITKDLVDSNKNYSLFKRAVKESPILAANHTKSVYGENEETLYMVGSPDSLSELDGKIDAKFIPCKVSQ